MKVLEERGYETIDLVIVNLYPFTETIKKGSSFEDAIENIDIGGVALRKTHFGNSGYSLSLSNID